MKIHTVEVDGFGVWSGLKLPAVDEALTVVYGPNEAGKTTLLEFIRAVLYGFSPARRAYLPPLHAGRAGGGLEISSPQGRFQLARHDDDPSGSPLGQLTITAADGTRHGEHFIKVLLAETDETIFDSVFAISLRELQELATLGDTQAAELLYNLSLGLDRVSLVDVIRALSMSREGILSPDGRPCQAAQLAAERDKLRAEIEQLEDVGRRYGRLAGERGRLDHQIGRLEQDLAQARHQARVLEIALAVRERWQRRADLQSELAAMGPAANVGPALVARLDRLNQHLARHKGEADSLKRRQAELESERSALAVNRPLAEQAARIEALSLQQSWIQGLADQIAGLQKEIAAGQSEQAAEMARIGLDSGSMPEISNRALSALRLAARGLRGPGQQVDQLRQKAQAARQTAQSLAEQLDRALSAQGERELGPAMERRAAEGNALRRRLQIDQRLEELARCRDELDDQGRQLLERQMLPLWAVLALGGVFMCGVVLLAAGMIMPASITGSLGWALAILGLAGATGAGIMKMTVDRSNSRQLEGCHKQSEMLQMQLKQAKQERDELDRQIPRGGGPLPVRHEKVEQQLAALEELVPLDARRLAALEEADALDRQSAGADGDRTAARRRWREALAAARLPESLTPRQIKAWARHGDRLAQINRRLAVGREELAQRNSQWEDFSGKVLQLLVDTGVETNLDQPLAQLRVLGEALAGQQELLRRRLDLRRQVRRLARQHAAREEAVAGFHRRRRQLLRRAGVRGEQELRQLALQASRAEVLRQQGETLQREIAAAIGGYCTEELVGQQLAPDAAARLESTYRELSERVALVDRQLQEQFERRGQLAEQLKALSDDRRLPQRQMELAVVEKRLADALRRWQVLAVTSRALDSVRATYERDRQPETLTEASGYLERLTGGRYRRVWTPLGEHVLRVDDRDGDCRAVDQLSRGTREQLLLALRLSLAAAYARRGAVLPMVLDDVLVNFDTHRANLAAEVLRDFAAAGHQLLVFTCHEHIMRVFRALDVPTIELPGGQERAQSAPSAEPAPKAESARRRRPRRAAKPEPPPERIAAHSEPPPVVPEPFVEAVEPPVLAPPAAEAIMMAESEPAELDDGLDDSLWEESARDDEDFSADEDIQAA